VSRVAGRLSVIINNYNYAQFVGATIDSALGLDWPDVEVVVVDDGSTDESPVVLKGYGDRIVAILQENQGQSTAANAGYAQSTGDVVIFLDSDDLLLPDLASRVMAEFAANPAIARVQWPMRTIDGDGNETGEITPPAPYVLPSGDLAPHVARFRNYIWNPTSASAYSADALDKVFPMPADVYLKNTGVDLYLSETIVFVGPVAALADAGTLYRVHGSNHSLRRRDELGPYSREKIREMLVGHEHAREVATRVAPGRVLVPTSALTPLDWAFSAYRLASIRSDPDQHPIPGDGRIRITLRGAWSVALHPMYSPKARVKRVAWFLAAGFAPATVGKKLLERGLLGPS
jgi:hypothetical protein